MSLEIHPETTYGQGARDLFDANMGTPLGGSADSGLTLEHYLDADQRTGTAANGKPSLTIDQAAAKLTGGDAASATPAGGWGVLGHSFTVSYAFRADAPATMPDSTGGFSQFSPAQMAQAQAAMQAWSDVANITFVRVGTGTTGAAAYSDNATILLGNYSTGEDGAAAFTYMPGSTAYSSASGDLWVNNTLSYNANPTTGNYGGQVLVHELGHAIGLDHPSDYDATSGQTFTYSADASYYEDDRQYSVMSYFSETNTGANYGGTYSAVPLLDDIKAAQDMYGANMSTRTGDTVYGFGSNTGEAWFQASSSSSKLVFAVWDAGGHDTFNFSGYSANQLIDLHAGDFSNVGGLTGNVAIAEGVTIENAVGGSGADTISGNGAGDSLDGGAGNDLITVGDGTNTLRGGDGNDSITGGSGFDDVNGNTGQDTIDGGSGGGDWLVGGQGNDVITSHASNDILYGNMGQDTLNGGTGSEIIRGGQGDDVMYGGAGDDWMSGDLGSDTLYGGSGADTFHASAGAGLDRVMDFNAAEGDRVQLDAGTQYTVTQSGADTVIHVGSNSADQIVLTGVNAASLPSGWLFEM